MAGMGSKELVGHVKRIGTRVGQETGRRLIELSPNKNGKLDAETCTNSSGGYIAGGGGGMEINR